MLLVPASGVAPVPNSTVNAALGFYPVGAEIREASLSLLILDHKGVVVQLPGLLMSDIGLRICIYTSIPKIPFALN